MIIVWWYWNKLNGSQRWIHVRIKKKSKLNVYRF